MLICLYMYIQWHSLTRDEQAKYYEKARHERQLHMQLYPGWSARDNYGYGTKKKKRKKERTPEITSLGGRRSKKKKRKSSLGPILSVPRLVSRKTGVDLDRSLLRGLLEEGRSPLKRRLRVLSSTCFLLFLFPFIPVVLVIRREKFRWFPRFFSFYFRFYFLVCFFFRFFFQLN